MLAQGLSRGGLSPNGIRVIPLVGQQDVSLTKLIRQRVGFGTIGDLSTSQT